MSTTPEPTLAHVSIRSAAFLTGATVGQIKTWIADGRVAVSKNRANTYVSLDDVERLAREDTTHEQP